MGDIFVCSVIAKLKEINQFVGVVVEENARAGLALEVNAVHIFAGHLQDLDLNLSLLEDRLRRGLFFVDLIVYLFFNFEVYFPRLF